MRTRKGWSQREAASKLGMGRDTLKIV
ncbi:hypothetical protein [Carnobacterium viridans]